MVQYVRLAIEQQAATGSARIDVVSRHSELPILVIGHAVFADMIVPRFDRGAILFLPRRFARLPDLGGQPGLAGFADVDTQRLGFFDQRGAQRQDRKSTRLNSSHSCASRMPSSA